MINSVPVLKNEIYLIEITGYGHEGEGVGHIDGFTVFVPFTAVGDVLTVKIIKVTPSHAFGRLERLQKPSPNRIVPECPVYGRCGGCGIMHLSYEEQLRFKRQRVVDALSRIGGLSDVTVLQTLPSPLAFGYRNKGQFPVGYDINGKVAAGFYAPRSHTIVPIEGCNIQHHTANSITTCVIGWMRDYNIQPYNESTKKGLIRHVYVRSAFKTGEIMVIIVANAKKLPFSAHLIKRLTEQDGNIKSIILNVNAQNTNVILGSENITLYGSDRITDIITTDAPNQTDLKFSISPHSFFQVNPQQTNRLYSEAVRLANIKENDTVFDIYCGIGTISLFAAKSAGQVIGIEIVEQAILDAKENARLNNITNTAFYSGDASEVTAKLIKQGINPDIIILDPPRKGCETTLLNTLTTLSPRSIVYVSCNPATLARDLKHLCEQGYNLDTVQPVDMFPQTGHVECVVLMYK